MYNIDIERLYEMKKEELYLFEKLGRYFNSHYIKKFLLFENLTFKKTVIFFEERHIVVIFKEIYPGQFEPSRSHKFIQLIEEHGKLLRNYTQNIDTLEQVAGIKNVIQCHGNGYISQILFFHNAREITLIFIEFT